MHKEHIIKEILAIELKMFQAVNPGNPSPCQLDPDGFRISRQAQFQAWSIETLASYNNDLETALQEGRNVLAEKYLRMEGKMEPRSQTRIIDEVVKINVAWQMEMANRYPRLIHQGRPITGEEGPTITSFQTYLRGELETYSDLTLSNLLKDLTESIALKENMTETIYKEMVKGYGYLSLEEAEESIRKGS